MRIVVPPNFDVVSVDILRTGRKWLRDEARLWLVESSVSLHGLQGAVTVAVTAKCAGELLCTAIPRLTSEPANEFFG